MTYDVYSRLPEECLFALHLAALSPASGGEYNAWRFEAKTFSNDLLILQERGLISIIDKGNDYWRAKVTQNGRSLLDRMNTSLRR